MSNLKFEARPELLAATPSHIQSMTKSRGSNAGTADRLPPVYRAGSMAEQKLPSRRGNRLFYIDGRVADAKHAAGQEAV